MTSPYQKEQSETLFQICRDIDELDPPAKEDLIASCAQYLQFRSDVDDFLVSNFKDICIQKCYESRLSACCTLEGVITYFADMVINALFSGDREIASLQSALQGEGTNEKCIYLGDKGCLWRIKPIVCEMFLCDRAKDEVFGENPECKKGWEKLEKHRKRFTWPDKPVLFDDLEQYFIEGGLSSPLMYFHNSPGLLRVKHKAKRE